MIEISDLNRVQLLQKILPSEGEALPTELVADYDCSTLTSILDGVLLSKRGVRRDGNLNGCQECDESLAKRSIPKFSIKNGFYVGELPTRFSDMTLTERPMTQTVSVVAITRVMRGGAHCSIRSHCLAFDATPGPPATLLLIPVGNISSFRVVLAWPFTPEQHARVRQMHRVRRQVVHDVLRFYQQHNKFYDGIVIDSSEISVDAIAENMIFEDVRGRCRDHRNGRRT